MILQSIPAKKVESIIEGMGDIKAGGVPLDPKARYFMGAMSGMTYPKDGLLHNEARFNCLVYDLLKPMKIRLLEKGSYIRPPDFESGDVIGVLNAGFVEFMDSMGSDDEIAEDARTSYKNSGRTSNNDGLIRYLYRMGHSSPFEMGVIKVRMCLPIFVYRQLFRHRTAKQLEPEGFITNDASFGQFSVHNEMSGRYVTMPNLYYMPEMGAIQGQSTSNKQGREKGALTHTEKARLRAAWGRDIKYHRDSYKRKIKAGMAKEIARCNLPNSQYTLLVWRIDIRNLFHFLGLRLHEHAQFEVREYARAIMAFAEQKFPVACQAFRDYHLDATRLSKQEWACLMESIGHDAKKIILDKFEARCDNKRELHEFASKLDGPLS